MTVIKDFLLLGPVDGQWAGADLAVVQYGRNSYVKVVFGQRQLFLYGPRERLTWALRACADMLDGIEPAPMVTAGGDIPSSSVTNLVTPASMPVADPVTNVTPAQVLEYFRQSPDLAPLAGDVATALAGQIAGDQVSQDVAAVLASYNLEDLVEGGVAIRGAQSRIAEALGIPNAGSHNRPRIRAILECLQARSNSTTTTKPSETAKNSDLRRLEAS